MISIEQIRLEVFQCRAVLTRMLEFLDGVTGLAREGDIVLSAEQANKLSGGISAICAPFPECRAFRDKLLALLESGRPDTEQAS